MIPSPVRDLAPQLESFFSQRLARDLHASPHTVAAYRDTFRLLPCYVSGRVGRGPAAMSVADFDAEVIASFLEYLERARGNTIRTRNSRLAAIHSFFKYLALRGPQYCAVAQQILAIPPKRTDRPLIAYLLESEVQALLLAPDLATWTGRRDRALLFLAVESGMRVSELTSLRIEDLVLGRRSYARCRGKGRKERTTPLRRELTLVLRSWLRESERAATSPLFPNARGEPLSRDGVAYLLSRHVAKAALTCPQLRQKRVTPHVLRHTAAMTLLEHGIDRAVIALWLGHESVESTEAYLHADLSIKQRALDRTAPRRLKGVRYRPADRLLAYLEKL